MELFEIRLLVVTEPEEAQLILEQIGDLVTGVVGGERFGAALFHGVNPNGTEVPEGFEAIEDETKPFGSEAIFSASGTKTEDGDECCGGCEIEGTPV
jgi:hypothetical protein